MRHALPDPVDPYDPTRLRSTAMADVEVEHLLISVPVRKPNKHEFFRVHPDEQYTTDARLFFRADGFEPQPYIVLPEVQEALAEDLTVVRLITCMTRAGKVFLWACKLPREGSSSRWAETALAIAELAKTRWVRMRGDRDLGGYEASVAKGDLGEPEWPDKPFRDIIKIAFGDHVIRDEEHPAVRELNGEL